MQRLECSRRLQPKASLCTLSSEEPRLVCLYVLEQRWLVVKVLATQISLQFAGHTADSDFLCAAGSCWTHWKKAGCYESSGAAVQCELMRALKENVRRENAVSCRSDKKNKRR